MIWSLLPLVVICLLFAGLAGQCSFNPGEPEMGPVRAIDVEEVLTRDAQALPFDVRVPRPLEGWTSNSHRRQDISTYRAIRTGFVTPGFSYAEVIQTPAPMEELQSLNGQSRVELDRFTESGTTWVTYGSTYDDAVKVVFAADEGTVRIAVTGKAAAEQMRELAVALSGLTPVVERN